MIYVKEFAYNMLWPAVALGLLMLALSGCVVATAPTRTATDPVVPITYDAPGDGAVAMQAPGGRWTIRMPYRCAVLFTRECAYRLDVHHVALIRLVVHGDPRCIVERWKNERLGIPYADLSVVGCTAYGESMPAIKTPEQHAQQARVDACNRAAGIPDVIPAVTHCVPGVPCEPLPEHRPYLVLDTLVWGTYGACLRQAMGVDHTGRPM